MFAHAINNTRPTAPRRTSSDDWRFSATRCCSGTTVTPFTVIYPDGSAHCAGVRVQRAGAHPLIRDLETCVTTLTVLAPGRYVIPEDTPWCSDFNGLDITTAH